MILGTIAWTIEGRVHFHERKLQIEFASWVDFSSGGLIMSFFSY